MQAEQTENCRQSILVTAASLHPDAVAMLSDYQLVYTDVRATEAQLAEAAAQLRPVAIVVRYGNVSRKVIEAAGSQLRVIAKHGVGIDNIDSSAAKINGIPVIPALGSNSQAVAEHAVCLMMACARQVASLDSRLRAGHWDKDNYAGLELAGNVLGLIGGGSIGMKVAAIANAIGMRVLLHDPYANRSKLPDNVELVELVPLLRTAQVISLHCPLTTETKGLLNQERLAMLKPGAILVNTARAGLFNEEDLVRALNEGRVVAGLDCFDVEPLPLGSPLASARNCLLTPHIGGTTTAAFRAMGVGAAQNVLAVLNGQ
ncbi:NAD(P)-dependent oxidoreductase [Cupriavidus oxalaticus]|uniref:NAD(P)-dependent oxidoreductase n=1 Tax=Cupriavidus oxalaticus TaxID=96344 RepID=UPI00403459C4